MLRVKARAVILFLLLPLGFCAARDERSINAGNLLKINQLEATRD